MDTCNLKKNFNWILRMSLKDGFCPKKVLLFLLLLLKDALSATSKGKIEPNPSCLQNCPALSEWQDDKSPRNKGDNWQNRYKGR